MTISITLQTLARKLQNSPANIWRVPPSRFNEHTAGTICRIALSVLEYGISTQYLALRKLAWQISRASQSYVTRT